VRDEHKEIKDKHYVNFIEIIEILDVTRSESTELEISVKLPY